MPEYLPPAKYSDTPHRYLLPAATMVWRVHRQKDEPADFTKYRRSRFPYGRFAGSPADHYSSWHASQDATTILGDILLRSVPVSADGFRTVRRVTVAGLRASALSTSVELDLVSLRSAPDLAAVAQDIWLITADELRNPLVQRWASWIRSQAEWAAGFIWPPRLSAQHHLIILFGDRFDDDQRTAIVDPDPIAYFDLDDDAGATWLNSVLRPHRARINPPRASRKR